MAALNPLGREVVLKIVFYGPGLGGKTTTLQHIHDTALPEHRGKMVSLATAVDRTLYFDFLPVRIPSQDGPLDATARGMSVRLQLFTVPGQVYYNATRKLVLTGADGVVFVADSQEARSDSNVESLDNLVDNLREQKRELAEVPHVLQYNKRDLDDVLPVPELERLLNRYGAPSVATTATKGHGVYDVLGLITRLSLDAFRASLPPENAGQLAGASLAEAEGGLEEALRGAPASLRSEEIPPTRAPAEIRAFTAAADENLIERAAADRAAPRGGVSFESLFAEDAREAVRRVEAALAEGQNARAVDELDAVLGAELSSVDDGVRDPLGAALLLGVAGPRYLAFRSIVRAARQGLGVDAQSALAAYAFVLDARLARGRVGL